MASLAPRFLAQHFAADVWPAVRALLMWRGDDTHNAGHSHSQSLSQSQSSHSQRQGISLPDSETETGTETEAARQRALAASPSLHIRAAALRCLAVVVQVVTFGWGFLVSDS
jgi:hypothetical protein